APGPSNLHLAAGSDTPEALMADIAEGFYVTDLIGVGVNQVTGDYSRGASGFWIENGKRSYPVSEGPIAGNQLDMFQAISPANDLGFGFGTNGPSVRVEGLTVAGRCHRPRPGARSSRLSCARSGRAGAPNVSRSTRELDQRRLLAGERGRSCR